MGNTLAIFLVQYKPDKTALKHTLDSILRQEKRDFELIIADDGSPQDYLTETVQYLAAHGFTNVIISKNAQNQGTVVNLRNALRKTTAEYVYGASPGDYFYDPQITAWIEQTARRDRPQVAVGRIAYYRCAADGTPHPIPGDCPFDRSCYRPQSYDAEAIKRNQLLYDDSISGNCCFYRRELLLAALEHMAGHVRLAEDLCLRLFAVQGVRFTVYDRVLCWYEYGVGISTVHTVQSKARILADNQAMLELLRQWYPQDRMVRRAAAYFNNGKRRPGPVRSITARILLPPWDRFKRAQKRWQPPVNGEEQKLLDIYAYNKEETL